MLEEEAGRCRQTEKGNPDIRYYTYVYTRVLFVFLAFFHSSVDLVLAFFSRLFENSPFGPAHLTRVYGGIDPWSVVTYVLRSIEVR